jgi:hypothetical protein
MFHDIRAESVPRFDVQRLRQVVLQESQLVRELVEGFADICVEAVRGEVYERDIQPVQCG